MWIYIAGIFISRFLVKNVLTALVSFLAHLLMRLFILQIIMPFSPFKESIIVMFKARKVFPALRTPLKRAIPWR
jgi:hypothetical protein